MTNGPRLAAVVGSLAFVCAAHAADTYRAELEAGYARAEGDDSDLVVQQTGLTATWFPREVSVGDGPWREAAFLDHASAVLGHVDRSTLEVGTIDSDGIGWGLGGQYAERDVPITVAAAAVFVDLKDDDSDEVEIDSRYWTVEAGYWVQRGLLVGPRYTYAKIKTGATGVVVADDRTDTYSLFGKWVTPVVDAQWVNVELDGGYQVLEQIDDSTSESWVGDLAVDWYPVPWIGIGPTVRLLSGEDDAHEGWTYGGRVTAWATPKLGIRGSITQFQVRDSDAGEDELDWSAEVIGRF